MSDEKRITIEDVHGGDGFGFRVKWSVVDHWADFEVYAVVSYEPETKVKYFRATEGVEEQTELIDMAERYASGYIKWDGCSHIDQHESHLCGAWAFKSHAALLRYLYLRAPELMGRGPDGLDEPWGQDEIPIFKAS